MKPPLNMLLPNPAPEPTGGEAGCFLWVAVAVGGSVSEGYPDGRRV